MTFNNLIFSTLIAYPFHEGWLFAGIAETTETSNFTSTQDRLVSQISKEKLNALREAFHEKIESEKPATLDQIMQELETDIYQDAWLSPIKLCPLDKPLTEWGSFLNMQIEDYLEVLEWTGRQHSADKPGKIPDHLDTILKRMQIETGSWLKPSKMSR